MEPLEAALRVLAEEAEPLHWTRIQDLALRRGYLDPFVERDIRARLVASLSEAAREGRVQRVRTGTYALPSAGAGAPPAQRR